MFSVHLYSLAVLFIQSWHLAIAANLTILVGGGPSFLSITPQLMNVTAPAVLRFSFKEGNHSVVQGDLDTPCQPKSGGFNSGFIPVFDDFNGSNPFYEIAITNNDPIFFYSSQGTECQKGMVGVINANNTLLGKYIAGAARAPSTTNTAITSTSTVPTVTSSPRSSNTPRTVAESSSPSSTASTLKTVNISGEAMIAGIVTGVAVLLLITGGFWIYWRRNISQKRGSGENKDSEIGGFSALPEVGEEPKRLTGLGISEVGGLERPYELNEKGLQEMETWERPQEMPNRREKSAIYELESERWI